MGKTIKTRTHWWLCRLREQLALVILKYTGPITYVACMALSLLLMLPLLLAIELATSNYGVAGVSVSVAAGLLLMFVVAGLYEKLWAAASPERISRLDACLESLGLRRVLPDESTQCIHMVLWEAAFSPRAIAAMQAHRLASGTHALAVPTPRSTARL